MQKNLKIMLNILDKNKIFVKIKKYNENLKNLDLLRSIAIILVVISHIPFPTFQFLNFYSQKYLGLLGVFIFFTHTSFVLMFSLERINLKNNFYFKFYTQRIFRIYPLSMLAVLVFFFIDYYFQNNFNTKQFLSNIFLVQNFTKFLSNPEPLWSLPYEVQMYLFLPIFFLLIKNKPKRIITIYIFTTIIVIFLKIEDKSKFYYDLVHFFPCFLSGIMGYVLFKNNKKKHSYFYLIIYLLTWIIVFPLLIKKNISENLLGTIFSLLLGLLISVTKEIKLSILSIIAKNIAKYSYSIYLFHMLPIKIFENLNIENFFKIPIIITFLLIFCYLSFNLIENPMIKLGKKLSKSL
jgi:peptidoglycan/LPS O-acetylase OafA/YrhL